MLLVKRESIQWDLWRLYEDLPVGEVLARWAERLMYLLLPEDTTPGASGWSGMNCRRFDLVLPDKVKVVVWYVVSIAISLLLGHLT